LLRLARSACALTARERGLALRALWYLILVDGGLRRTQRVPDVLPQPRGTNRTVTVSECADAVRRAARLWPRATCLSRALAGQRLLGDASATVAIGVRRDATALRAHAWLESNGAAVIGGGESDAYARLGRPDQ
jgi:hypothetical protein